MSVQRKTCCNLVADWCDMKVDSPDPEMERECHWYARMTNADRLRKMTDEELAEFLYHAWNNAAWCSAKDCADDESCFPCWLDWLKEEVEDVPIEYYENGGK